MVLHTNDEIQLQVNGRTIISLRSYKNKNQINNNDKVDNNIKGAISKGLAPILSHLLNIGKNTHELSSYTAVFSDEMKDLLRKGVAEIHKDTQGNLLPQIIHSQNGKIIRKVRLKSGISAANITLLGWQIASMITAQKYLLDINNKLKAIAKSVKYIQALLENELFSKIESRISGIEALMMAISSNFDFSKDFNNFHAPRVVSSMEEIDEFIRRVNGIIDIKLKAFSEEIFVEGALDQLKQKYETQVNEIIFLMGNVSDLFHAQSVLCIIYKLYAENSSYTKKWESNLSVFYSELQIKIELFGKIQEEQINKVDSDLFVKEIATDTRVLTSAIATTAATAGFTVSGKNTAAIVTGVVGSTVTGFFVNKKIDDIGNIKGLIVSELIDRKKRNSEWLDECMKSSHRQIEQLDSFSKNQHNILIEIDNLKQIANMYMIDNNEYC